MSWLMTRAQSWLLMNATASNKMLKKSTAFANFPPVEMISTFALYCKIVDACSTLSLNEFCHIRMRLMKTVVPTTSRRSCYD